MFAFVFSSYLCNTYRYPCNNTHMYPCNTHMHPCNTYMYVPMHTPCFENYGIVCYEKVVTAIHVRTYTNLIGSSARDRMLMHPCSSILGGCMGHALSIWHRSSEQGRTDVEHLAGNTEASFVDEWAFGRLRFSF